jgi:hypothetical protein
MDIDNQNLFTLANSDDLETIIKKLKFIYVIPNGSHYFQCGTAVEYSDNIYNQKATITNKLAYH